MRKSIRWERIFLALVLLINLHSINLAIPVVDGTLTRMKEKCLNDEDVMYEEFNFLPFELIKEEYSKHDKFPSYPRIILKQHTTTALINLVARLWSQVHVPLTSTIT